MAKDVMIDLETLGVGTFPVILSIGAVRFDPAVDEVPEPRFISYNPHALIVDSFYRTVDVESGLGAGGTISQETFKWWLDDEQAAPRRALFAGQAAAVPLPAALGSLWDWLTLSGWGPPNWVDEHRAGCVWSHGIGFDVAILKRAAERVGHRWPIDYRAERDTRTLWDLAPIDDVEIARPDGFVKHHAAWDAWLQARRVQIALKRLKNGNG